MSKLDRRYGWIPDLPDIRDYKFAETKGFGLGDDPIPDPEPETCLDKFLGFFGRKPKPKPKPVPPSVRVDLTVGPTASAWPGIFDQGRLGSCTANAWVAPMAYRAVLSGEEKKDSVFSRFLLYGEERGWVQDDTGAMIRDGVKAMSRVGDCPEQLWPYDLQGESGGLPLWQVKPPASVYSAAQKRKAITYARLESLADMKKCLSDGHPFVGGFSVYEPFEELDAAHPILPMPRKTDEFLGGHAVCFVGFDDKMSCFLVRNSWGADWCLNGLFYMPYTYATDLDLADDFWTVRTVPIIVGPG